MDFTWFNEPVWIAEQKAPHRLFHYRLPYSSWSYAEPVYGGESFSAMAVGLQNAFKASGGTPRELRTDSLSAAYKNRSEAEDFTARYQALCDHYQIRPSRNNRGVAHENGAIESPNRHLKDQLKQALLLRGHSRFESRDEYSDFIREVVERRNRRYLAALAEEQRQLHPLPAFDSVNYSQHCVRVSSTSTVQLKRVTYTVPSRLVGARLMVHLFDDRLELWCQGELTLTLERLHARNQQRLCSVNYQHVIDALVKKPRAFRQAKWRDELLPNPDYERAWQYVDNTLPTDDASHYIVRVLYLAKRGDCEGQLGRYLLAQIEAGTLPTLRQLEQQFLDQELTQVPTVPVRQHALSDYQSLLVAGGAA